MEKDAEIKQNNLQNIFLQSPVLTSILMGSNFIYAEKIFVIFQRLKDFYTYVGTGIGLGLCKKIVLNNDGEIFAKSQENLGSCFHIILPHKHLITRMF